MKQEDFFWKTTDGLKIYGTHWPVTTPRAVIALVHGLGEHINRYVHLAAFFNKNDIALIGYDRRGHCQSEGKRGHTPNVEAFLDEIQTLLEKTEAYYPGIPVFLYGHSMGGNLVLTYALRRELKAIGLISTAPHIRLGFEPPANLVAFGKVIRKIHPAFTQSNGLKVEHISSDPQVVQRYIDDPLVHDRITSATGIGMLEAAKWLDNYTGKIPLPALLMHGEADQITSPEGSELFAKRVEGDIKLKIWPGLYHEIHNEKEQAEVFRFTLNWMNQYLNG